MVIPLGAGGAGGPQAAIPPPPELQRYEPMIKIVGISYLVIVVLRFIAGDVSSALQELFVLLAAFFMVSRGPECFMQCLMPFFIFAVMAFIFDAASLIKVLFDSYPGANNMFAGSCPYDEDIKLTHSVTVTNGDKNLTVYVNGTAASVAEALLPAGDYKAPVDVCNFRWICYNIANIVAVVMGWVASSVGWRMFKVLRDMNLGGQDPLLGGMMGAGGGPGGDGPGPGPGPRPGFDGGAGRPLGGGGGGREMQQPQGQQGGFRPFGGTGQSLGN